MIRKLGYKKLAILLGNIMAGLFMVEKVNKWENDRKYDKILNNPPHYPISMLQIHEWPTFEAFSGIK